MWWTIMAAMANPGAFEGTWVFAGNDAERQAITAAVEDGAQRFNFAIRPIARSKLTQACALDESLIVSGDPGQVTIQFTGANARTSSGPTDGSKVDVRGSMVSYTIDGQTMTIDGANAEGGKRSVYRILDDGRLKASHTISSKSLGDPPLTWTLTYKKQ